MNAEKTEEFERSCKYIADVSKELVKDKNSLELQIPRLKSQKNTLQIKLDEISREILRLQKLRIKLVDSITDIRGNWEKEKKKKIEEIKEFEKASDDLIKTESDKIEKRKIKLEESEKIIEAKKIENQRFSEAIENKIKENSDILRKIKETKTEVEEFKKENSKDMDSIVKRDKIVKKQENEIKIREEKIIDNEKLIDKKVDEIGKEKEKIIDGLNILKAKIKRVDMMEMQSSAKSTFLRKKEIEIEKKLIWLNDRIETQKAHENLNKT